MTFRTIKDPADVVVWDIRWDEWLSTGETISTSVWSVDASESPVTLNVDSDAIVAYTGVSPELANTVARVTTSGGTAGLTYRLTNKITTSDSQTFERTIAVQVYDR